MNPFAEFKEEWEAMTDGQRKTWKWVLIGSGVFVVGCGLYLRSQAPSVDAVSKVSQNQINAQGRPGAIVPDFRQSAVVPPNQRNQGLEDMAVKLETFESALRNAGLLDKNGNIKVPTVNADASAGGDQRPRYSQGDDVLSKPLPPANGGPVDSKFKLASSAESEPAPVQFSGQPGSRKPQVLNSETTVITSGRQPISFVRERKSASSSDQYIGPVKVVPTSSGLDSVMLTGVNAGVSKTGTQTTGSVMSASAVGSPFVTRIKGEAILPNGWRLEDLGDCFVSGNAIGILSTERANAIAKRLSCIHEKNGVVIEQDIKAYAVDVDGIQGIVGKVVSKQGGVIGMAFLAGVASGFGTSITPISVLGTGGTGISTTTPSANTIARNSVGQGLTGASNKLADFYLQYASQMFPVVEVASGTRVTWVLTEPLELKPKVAGK